jgi:transcription elongation factor Elf1
MAPTLPITCPICGRKKEYEVVALVEGARLECPFCGLKLTLHGHMLREVREEIEKLTRGGGISGSL